MRRERLAAGEAFIYTDLKGPAAVHDKPMQKLLPNFLRTTGLALILVGMVAAYYGPLEIYVFYFFSDGGRFHYDGFGVGSFWFAALVVQNLGYYLVAALLIPVGIGHVRLRRWALTLTRLYLWIWLGTGILLCINLIGLAPSLSRLDLSRETLILRLGVVGAAAFVLLILSPLLGLRFYRSEKVRSIFEAHDPNQYWTERTPLPVLALLLLFGIMILVLHIGIFFQSMFPVFGQIRLGRPMVYVYSACILITGILMYGTARLKTWAWWSSLVFVSLLAVSTILSFSRYSFSDLIQMMDLPAYEMEFLKGMVLFQDTYLVVLLAAPLLAALGLVIYSRRYYRI